MNKIVVKIANQEYTITGEEEKDYILSLASHVDEQIRIAQNKAPKINNLTPVILASINITDQLFKEIKKSREMSNQINGEKSYTDQDKITREGDEHVTNSNLIDEQDQTIEKLYDQIQKLDKALLEKNAEINSLLSKLEDVKLMNKELDDLLNQFQNDMHDIQIELNTKVGNEDI